jgi:hypothetical protein
VRRTTQLPSNRVGRRLYGLLLAALGLVGFWASPAQAGVEFVTRTADCTKVDRIGDGKDLFIMAGRNVRFRVFGNSVDLSNPTNGFRIATDSGAGDVRAKIVSQGTDCGGTGFALVDVDSPANLNANIQRSLFFKMPFGDESRLQMTIKAFPAINVVWRVQQDIGCIGGFTLLNQDHRMLIRLPPGHQQDETTCNNRTAFARVTPASLGEVGVFKKFNYSVTGLPGFATSEQAFPQEPNSSAEITFPIDVGRIRALNATSNRTLTISSVSNRTATLDLTVVPNLSNGFAQAAKCRNLQTGALVNVNDQVHCELRLAFPPPSDGQRVSFEVTDKDCVVGSGYAAATGKGSVNLTGTGNVFDVLLVTALGGASSLGTPCASLSGVQATVLFWIGEEDTSTPDTKAIFRIVRRP